jgi:hypothetical protein
MAIAKEIISPEMKELNQFEADLEKLKVVFEQYFAGVEKIPPTEKLEEIRKTLRNKILKVKSNNTGYKFKRQSMEQKFITLSNYWQRVLNEIEEGKYVRLVKRAQLHEKQKTEYAEEAARKRVINEAIKNGQPIAEALKAWESRKNTPEEKGADTPKQGTQAPRPSPAAQSGATAASPIDRLHDAYMAARSKTGEGAVDRAAFTAMIQKQIPAIKQKFNCKTVEFKVVVEDGKTKLKAIPKN